ncbi:MAG: MSEP-CTERM sorting domain-containing protein [Ignavibacteriae bacterium]|nr:MSEP-CTERM sorting domain-containing protein [Ignavibacteriota bacterium]
MPSEALQFYVLAIINGILICLPNIENKLYRMFVFIGRSITFTFTFYFFLVFLPFLPLSIVAIVAIGIGFLMLTPLLLFVIHINELSKDFTYLKKHFSQKIIWLVSLVGLLVIPFSITHTYLKDKNVVNETLDYIYTPDFSKSYQVDKSSLQKTLNVVKQHKDRFGGGIFGTQIPYLSTYFNWLVLDNLTLSDAKINTIEKIFFGKTSFDLRPENIQNKNVEITNFTSNSTFDKSQNAWISWIDLEITNKSENTWFAEYATTIELPVGCWISDYYLYVGERKEMGILAEKKSAMWVFSQIRNENRDLGILYYLTGNKVAFRVFPFAKDEVRKTGIEFLHKEPLKLTIDGNLIELGNAEETKNKNIETDNTIYVSSQQKKTLNQIQRKPYFHFLVDISKGINKNLSEITNRIDQAVIGNKSFSENAKISFVNSYVTTIKFDDNWKQSIQNQNFEGGFYLDRAIKETLFNAYQEKTNIYPVIVVVTDNIQKAIFAKDFSDFKITFPESDMFFDLKENGKLEPHSLISNSIRSLSDTISYSSENSVLEYKHKDNSIYYLSQNNESSIILKSNVFEISETEIKEKN